MYRIKWIGIVLALLLACTSVGVFAAAPLRIGAILPLTGDLQTQGVPSLQGVKLAAEEINQAGGVRGVKIKIFSGDTQTAPQQSVSAAQQLINTQNVVGLVGAMSSGDTIPIALTVAKPRKVPEIATGSTSPKITDLKDDDFLFRTIPSDAFQGVALAQVVHDAGVEKVDIIYVDNAYGEGLKDSFARAFKKRGGSIGASAAYEARQPSYNAEISKASGNGATKDLVLLAYPENGQIIIRESLESNKFNRFFFADGMKSNSLVKNLGAEYLNGSLGTAPQAKKGSESAKRFINAYKKAYGKLPSSPYAGNAYDALYLLALAAEKADTTTSGPEIRDALRAVANPPGTDIHSGEWSKAVKLIKAGKNVNWVGAAGEENFDKHGDVSGSFGEWTIKSGEIKTLKVFTPSK